MFRTASFYFRKHTYLEVVTLESGAVEIRVNQSIRHWDVDTVPRLSKRNSAYAAEKGFRPLIYLTGAPGALRAWLGLGKPPESGL
jgi:hypothetical protein